MKKQTALLWIIFISNAALAQGQPVPHEFANGNAIVATEFNANFQELSNRNKNAKDQVDQNTAAIDALETTVNGLQATTSQNSASIATTQTNVSNVQATASQNASDISSVESSLSTVQGSVSQNTADLVTLNTNIASIDGTVTQIQSDLANLQTSGGAPLLQFVGNSTGTMDGGQGIRTMIELCQVDYPGSRMCTTEEYAKSTNFPAAIPDTTFAWVMPSQLVGSGTGAGSGTPLTDNFSGLSTPTHGGDFFTCRGWTFNVSTTGIKAISVSGTGQFKSTFCDVIQPVSCCK